jgi:hypothetical protein
MGCCQGGSVGNEVVIEKGSNEIIQSMKPIYFIASPSESEAKCEPTPSFGSLNKKFSFDSGNQALEIN